MARPKGTTRPKKPITQFEFQKLIEFTQKSRYIHQQGVRVKFKRLFTLMYLTGCRISEVMHLTTDHIQEMILHKELALANNTKTNRPRLIVLSDNQLELLRSILPSSKVKLFADCTTGYMTIKANDILHHCLGELYSTHSFRAGYITRLAINGENIKLIQEDIGHTSIQTTARYIKVTDDDKRKAKDKLVW